MDVYTIFVFSTVAIVQAYRWPEGNYGILSHDKCPQHWFEFSHCMETKDGGRHKDDVSRFRLGFGNLCTRNTLAIRYCFKGKQVPTRKGGFWTKSGSTGNAFVIKNVRNGCCFTFGSDGGHVILDNKHGDNKTTYGNNALNGHVYKHYHPSKFHLPSNKRDTRLEFCKIGEKHSKSKRNYMEVGTFGKQTFGLLVHPGKNCPILQSPYGLLHGLPEVFSLIEHANNKDKISGGAPVDVAGSRSIWTACEYDPLKTKS